MHVHKWTLVSLARTGRTRMFASPTSTWRCLPLPLPQPFLPRSQQIVERNKRANSSIKKQRKSQIILIAIAWMIYKKNHTKTATTTRQIDKQQKKVSLLPQLVATDSHTNSILKHFACNMQMAQQQQHSLLLPLQQHQLARCITV